MNATKQEQVQKFKPGERVRHKSGDIDMTVMDVGIHTDTVWCQWMSKEGLICEATFPASVLWVVGPECV